MFNKKKKSLIFSIGHSYDLIFFLRLNKELNIKNKYNIRILFFSHLFKNKIKIVKTLLRKISNDITIVDNYKVPHYKINIFKNIYLGLKLKKLLKKNFSKNECILLVDKSCLHSNILLNFFNKPILFQFFKNKIHKNAYKKLFFKTIGVNLINFFLKNNFIKVFKYKNTQIENYEANLKHVEILYISNRIRKNVKSVNFSKVKITNNRKIVFFGTRYYYYGLKKSSIDRIFQFYLSTYKKFNGNYEFYYLMHPKEKGAEFEDINIIFKNKIKLIKNYLNAEHYLIENNDVAHCFS